jgi:hypothetical protein
MRAYDDKPFPIGERQTISQPYMVGLMTQALELRGGERVLEIGTGCGYQTAVLAEIAATVYTIERLARLAAAARTTLESCGYTNVVTRVGDGSLGWAEEGPFDAIWSLPVRRRFRRRWSPNCALERTSCSRSAEKNCKPSSEFVRKSRGCTRSTSAIADS